MMKNCGVVNILYVDDIDSPQTRQNDTIIYYFHILNTFLNIPKNKV